MPLTRNYLQFNFTLATGNFDGGGNTYQTTPGLRASATILKAGSSVSSTASFAVYGLDQSTMNKLTTFGDTLTLTGRNTVDILAGTSPSNLSTVFSGTINPGFMDANSMPNVSYRGEAFTGFYEKQKPTAVTSMPGSVDASSMLQKLATQAGFSFEGNGLSAKIQNPYYSGTVIDQINAICHDVGAEHILDNNKLAVWTAGSQRSGSVDIGPDTGLCGYPSFNSLGVVFRCLFNPNLQYGSTVNLTSSITPACGPWIIHRLEYELESSTPNGRWFAIVEAHKSGQQPVVS